MSGPSHNYGNYQQQGLDGQAGDQSMSELPTYRQAQYDLDPVQAQRAERILQARRAFARPAPDSRRTEDTAPPYKDPDVYAAQSDSFATTPLTSRDPASRRELGSFLGLPTSDSPPSSPSLEQNPYASIAAMRVPTQADTRTASGRSGPGGATATPAHLQRQNTDQQRTAGRHQ
ncbi:hypothetical protein ABT336_07360 [Micromonospora sp. NPDC000207]|uniref:hypothetical protein n=1 Tax=Micromonospora sp. NPDC000207 TaxID=3154246 RepID=UPI00332C3BE8